MLSHIWGRKELGTGQIISSVTASRYHHMSSRIWGRKELGTGQSTIPQLSKIKRASRSRAKTGTPKADLWKLVSRCSESSKIAQKWLENFITQNRDHPFRKHPYHEFSCFLCFHWLQNFSSQNRDHPLRKHPYHEFSCFLCFHWQASVPIQASHFGIQATTISWHPYRVFCFWSLIGSTPHTLYSKSSGWVLGKGSIISAQHNVHPLFVETIPHNISAHITTYYHIWPHIIASSHILPHASTDCHIFSQIIAYYNILWHYGIFPHIITFYYVLAFVTTYYHVLPHIIT